MCCSIFSIFWCLLQILDSVANSTHHQEAKMSDEFITFHLRVNYIPRLLRDFHGCYQFTKTKVGNTDMNSNATSYCSLGCPKTTVHKHEKVGSTYRLRHQTKASNLDFNFLLTSKHYLATLYSEGKAQNNCPIWLDNFALQLKCLFCALPRF